MTNPDANDANIEQLLKNSMKPLEEAELRLQKQLEANQRYLDQLAAQNADIVQNALNGIQIPAIPEMPVVPVTPVTQLTPLSLPPITPGMNYAHNEEYISPDGKVRHRSHIHIRWEEK
jgi:hypothetical protein